MAGSSIIRIASLLFIISSLIVVKSQKCTNVKWKPVLISNDNDRAIVIENPSDYPGSCVEMIWTISDSAKIKVDQLSLDGQSGDFLIISSNPPLNEGSQDVQNIMPVGDFTLLTWVADAVNITVLSPSGFFIYFHGQVAKENRTKFQDGFRIELSPFRFTPPTEAPTTEKVIPTAEADQEIFVTKFLTGMHPADFVKSLSEFKTKLATMAQSFVQEYGIIVPAGIGPNDVVINKMNYCDETWPKFGECVEVKFAIAVVDDAENYVMLKPRLDIMWDAYPDPIAEMGLKSFTPPETKPEIVPWIWVAAMLGVIVVFSVGLCVVWLRSDDTLESMRSERIPDGSIENPNNVSTYFDPLDPVSAAAVKKIKHSKKQEDMELINQRRRQPQIGSFYRQHDAQPNNTFL